MKATTRAVMNPLLIVMLLIALFMWFLNLAPTAVSLGLAGLCALGLVAIALIAKKDHEKARRMRNHRRKKAH